MKFIFTALFILSLGIQSFAADALMVEKTSPQQFEKNVSMKVKISVFFNKPVIPGDLNKFTCVVNDGTSDISGIITYNETECRADFLPDTMLKSGHEYYVRLEKGIRAQDGTSLLEPVRFSFLTEAKGSFDEVFKKSVDFYSAKGFQNESKDLKEYRPLKVTSFFPEDLSSDLPSDTKIWAGFSEAVNPKTLNSYTFMVKLNTKNIEGTVHYNPDLKRAEFIPTRPLEKGTVYKVILTSYIGDREDNFLAEPVEWVFKTESEEPVAFLEVVNSQPKNFQSDVNPMSKISVSFNEIVDIETINRFTVALSDGKENIYCSLNYNESLNNLAVVPEKYLAENTWYTLTLRQGIKSRNSRTFRENVTIQFRTAVRTNVHQDIVKEKIKKEEAIAELARQKEEELRKEQLRLQEEKKRKEQESAKVIVAEKIKVVKAYPHIDEKAVKVDGEYMIEFNVPLYSRTVNRFTVIVSDGYDTVWGDVSYDSAHNRIIYKPFESLKYNKSYYIQLSSHIADMESNHLDRVYKWWFETENPPDTTPPAIISNWPDNDEIKVVSNPEVNVVFNEEIQPMSLNIFTFYLTDGHRRVKCSTSYSAKMRTAYLKPEEQLTDGHWYNLYITDGILDIAGNKLATPKHIKFLVGLPPDVSPPLIDRISPAKDAVIEKLTPIISVTFNEPVKSATLTPYSFYVEDAGIPVAGKLSYNRMTNTAVFEPLVKLLYHRKYKVTVKKGIEDLSGNVSTVTTSWYFTTYNPEEDRPYVVSSYPANGAKDIPLQTRLVVAFNRDINPAALNRFTVKLYKDSKKVDGNIEYNKAKNELYFHPAEFLSSGGKYEFVLNKGIQDTRGKNLKEDYRVVFYTE